MQIRQRDSVQVDHLYVSPNIFGNVWYLDGTNGASGNSGRDPLAAKSTIAQVVSVSAAGDTVVVAPGTYTVDVGTAAMLPTANQYWRAAQLPAPGAAPTVIFTQDADDNVAPIVSVDVNGVIFEGIEFKLVAGGTTALYLIDAAQTTAVRGLSFENCWFNLNGVDAAVKALKLDDATNAVVGMTLRNCRFVGGSGTTSQVDYIQVGVGGLESSLAEHNIFELESADADCYGFHFADPGATAKSYGCVIRNNDFIGPVDAGEDGVGVFFAAAMTETEIVSLIRTNYFAYCSATPVTIDEMNKGVVNNYVGDNDTGGTLVDPGT